LTILALAVAALASDCARDFPSRPVTTVVPFAAGGAGDILSRIVGKQLDRGSASRSRSRTSPAPAASPAFSP
jgi:tripartite-type tricarboxylate transporter receptor subunit TctC